MRTDIGPLAEAISGCLDLPLLAVGSGGSLSVAEFAAKVHRDFTGLSSVAQTALEASAGRFRPESQAVFMTTAGGRNPDVLGSFRSIASHEPRKLVVLCLSTGSPLSKRAERFPFVDFIELMPPTANDGFLATNSLIASVVLILRAYGAATGRPLGMPRSWRELLGGRTPKQIRADMFPAFQRRTLITLHGPDTRPAAVDIESKMTEAALGNVWIADFRHFAHGRHHWLAKKANDSAVLALTTATDRVLAERTLRLLPSEVYVVREEVPYEGPLAALAALARVMHISEIAGAVAGIDPGRPGVPAFGRRIYHLNAFSRQQRPAWPDLAIRRKSGVEPSALPAGELAIWRDAFRRFVSGLEAARFSGVVLDYDGTLSAARREPLSGAMAQEISRLLEGGLYIGVATGRGRSVRERLRESVPRALWPKVLVGYYNGGDIAPLSDGHRPDGSPTPAEPLREAARALGQNRLLRKLLEVEVRIPQIKIEVRRGADTEQAWALVQELVMATAPEASLLRSSHSMDLIAPGVDKRNVVERLRTVTGGGDILCVGDRGRFPGNDYRLLGVPLALSVDECAPGLENGWSLAPLGYRGPAACLAYLRGLSLAKGRARFRLGDVRGGRR